MNSSGEPMVSVIVLTYNQEQMVGQTLDSILSQRTDFAFEIIIGEDASPSDNTRAVCEAYAEKYPDIVRLMPKAANKGLLRNYVDCLRECRGKYIAGCAGDDWWHNDEKLQMQVDFLEQNPNYVMVYSGAVINNLTTGHSKEYFPTHPTANLFEQLLEGNFITASTTCYRAQATKAIDFETYISEGFLMEDYPMWLEMSRIGKFHCIDQCLGTYVVSSGTLSNAKSIEQQEKFEKGVLKIIQHFTRDDRQIDQHKLLNRHHRSLMCIGMYYGKWWYVMRQIWYVGRWKMNDWLRFALLITPFGICYLKKRANR